MEANAYMFNSPLREPWTIVIAQSEEAAMVEFERLTGKVEKPKKVRPAYIADPEVEDVLRISQARLTPQGEYKVNDDEEFPLLSYFGPRSITPEWVIDARSKTVRMAGEYESFPREMLDLSEKPTHEEVVANGGRLGGMKFDQMVDILADAIPTLRLEDGEDIRARLLDECSRFDRVYL